MIILRIIDRKTGEEISVRSISTEFSIRAINDSLEELGWYGEILEVRP